MMMMLPVVAITPHSVPKSQLIVNLAATATGPPCATGG
jgi:hypothetical protein